MTRSPLPALCAALACLAPADVAPFAPVPSFGIRPPSPAAPSLHLFPGDPSSLLLSSASTLVATIDSDIASIPDDEFGRVFAGAGFIILGSLLSLVVVGYLVESNGMYADLVAETYAEQDFATEARNDREFAAELGMSAEEAREAEEMVRAFQEKKRRKAGTWTAEDEGQKRQLQEEREEQDMFSDYD